MKIDKSVFSAEELAQYEALIAKAKVDPEAAEEEMEDEKPAIPPVENTEEAEAEVEAEVEEEEETKKSVNPELAAALARLEKLEKSAEMKEFSDIAKKYALLGEDEEELAKNLYEMKKSNEANYNAYIGVLDKSLAIVEKSGLFTEIGKSTTGKTVSGAEAKAIAKANEIRKSHPGMSETEAIAKAWEDPEIMAEYDAEYNA